MGVYLAVSATGQITLLACMYINLTEIRFVYFQWSFLNDTGSHPKQRRIKTSHDFYAD